MDGRKFLNAALVLVSRHAEEHWRTTAGRAYYALFLECRDALFHWGFSPSPRDNVHTFVRLRYSRNGDLELKIIGRALEDLGRLRNEADYSLTASGSFASDAEARKSIQRARDALALLEQITADPTREASAIAAIQAAWP
jgi:uncharacterized protein (UPF0332 family)